MHTHASFLDMMTTRIVYIMFAIGGLLLSTLLGLTLLNILLRLVPHIAPLRGVVEISGYLGAAAMGMCLPMAQQQGSHILTGMAVGQLPRALRRMQDVAVLLVSLAFMVLAAVEMAALGLFVREYNELIEGWNISYDLMVFALAAGCAGQALVIITDAVRMLGTMRRARTVFARRAFPTSVASFHGQQALARGEQA